MRKIKETGFTGIYIDRDGYPDGAARLEAEIAGVLGTKRPLLVSERGTLSFWRLTDPRQLP